MFRNYVLVALRNLVKQKLFAGINIVVLAAPLAWLVMTQLYLVLFPQRIEWIFPHIGYSALGVLLLAWAVVSLHAFRIAQENPVHTLRYE